MLQHIAPLVFLVAAFPAAPGSAAAHDSRTAHGGFTGEVKPVLYVADVEKSAPFFRDVLGFELLDFAGSDDDPYYAELAAGEQKIGLHEPTAPSQETRVGQQRIYFRIEDLARHRARVVAWGAEPGAVVETAWMDYFIVRDPDGNEIVFAVTDPERHSIDPW